jgi:hypothetical protein
LRRSRAGGSSRTSTTRSRSRPPERGLVPAGRARAPRSRTPEATCSATATHEQRLAVGASRGTRAAGPATATACAARPRAAGGSPWASGRS